MTGWQPLQPTRLSLEPAGSPAISIIAWYGNAETYTRAYIGEPCSGSQQLFFVLHMSAVCSPGHDLQEDARGPGQQAEVVGIHGTAKAAPLCHACVRLHVSTRLGLMQDALRQGCSMAGTAPSMHAPENQPLHNTGARQAETGMLSRDW